MIDTPDTIHAEYEALIGETLPRVFYSADAENIACWTCADSEEDTRVDFTIGDMLGLMIAVNSGRPGQSGESWSGDQCRGCGRKLHGEGISGLRMANSWESRHALTDLDDLASMSWFHATEREGWDEALTEGKFDTLHAGARITALDRAIQRRLESITMFELEIVGGHDGRNPMGEFIDDAEEDWANLRKGEVFPYINDWETPGVTSIYAFNDSVEIVGSETIDVVDLRNKIMDVRNRELKMLGFIVNEVDPIKHFKGHSNS